jgi:hypothetical protein
LRSELLRRPRALRDHVRSYGCGLYFPREDLDRPERKQQEGATMSTRSNVVRLAIFGLLVTRAPRWVQRPLGYMLLGVILCFVLIALGVVARANEVCTVADPSGTPLNVRSQPKPNGSILGALNNDTSVVVKERRGQWASIVPESAGKSGWVWAEYLSCGKNLPANATEPRIYDCNGEQVEVTFYDHHGGEVTVYHIDMDIGNGRAWRYVRDHLEVKDGPRSPLTIRFEPDPPKLPRNPRLTVNGHRCRQK